MALDPQYNFELAVVLQGYIFYKLKLYNNKRVKSDTYYLAIMYLGKILNDIHNNNISSDTKAKRLMPVYPIPRILFTFKYDVPFSQEVFN